MSDGQSQILPFPFGTIGAMPPHPVLGGKVVLWPEQMSVQALLRQNAALRAQNTALKQALEGEAGLLPRVERAARVSDLSAGILVLPPLRQTTPDPATEIRQCLTQRQRQVLALVLAGCPSKNIAADLGISQRTVENHRAAIMRRTAATSIPALARIVIGAAQVGDCKAAGTRHPSPR